MILKVAYLLGKTCIFIVFKIIQHRLWSYNPSSEESGGPNYQSSWYFVKGILIPFNLSVYLNFVFLSRVHFCKRVQLVRVLHEMVSV